MEPTRISDSTAIRPATTAIQKMDDTIDSGGSSSSSSSSPSLASPSPTPAATPVAATAAAGVAAADAAAMALVVASSLATLPERSGSDEYVADLMPLSMAAAAADAMD